jgi:hypothetical protein
VLWTPRLAGPLDLRSDGGAYYVLGTALAEGRGYRLLNEPGAIEAIQYPPLLPMIVAAHQWWTGSADPAVAGTALRRTWAALFVLYGLLVYALARRWLRSGWALVTTLLVLLNLQLLWLSDALFAELPFACAATAFVLVAERDDRRGIAAMLAAAAYLLRTAGLALFAAWIAEALWQRRWLEAALRAGLAALPIVVWQAYVAEVQDRPSFVAPAYAYQRAPYQFHNVGYLANLSYVDAFVPERGTAGAADLVRRVWTNVLALPEALGESVSVRAEGPLHPVLPLVAPDPRSDWSLAVGRVGFALVGLVATAGLGLLAADGIRLAPLVWGATLALVAVTPWPPQLGRYLMPIAPLTACGLILVFANAARLASRTVQVGTGAAIGVLLSAQVLVLGVVFTERHQPVDPAVPGMPPRLFFYGPAWRRHDAALAWLGRTAPPDAIVATATPHRAYLVSGRRAVLPPFESDPEAAARLLADVPVDYLVVDGLDFLDVVRRYGAPAVAARPEGWRLVYEAAGGPRIYARVAAPHATGPG